MAGVVKSMESAMKSMNLEKVSDMYEIKHVCSLIYGRFQVFFSPRRFYNYFIDVY